MCSWSCEEFTEGHPVFTCAWVKMQACLKLFWILEEFNAYNLQRLESFSTYEVLL